MKKIFFYLVLIVCAVSMVSCGNKNPTNETEPSESVITERGTGYVLNTEHVENTETGERYYKYSELERTLEKIKEKTQP